MNKSELIEAVAQRANLSKKDATSAVNAIFDASGVIAGALKKGDRVAVTGFGTFEVRNRAARTGRNPRTGQEIRIPASKSPAFKPGKSLKDAL